ncbi:peptidoglycan-binding domain-containing protein [Streptomyces sp. DSM 40750]|uniref:peptidoglycan-binding domain-containing protein n=1 Tax=Streptomyces sp. DSM 40750 TaxID=2801030 RepID=UPI00214AA662|nr:peptidoglycan-binding protein [Streptomyces sp. DSM 40750]UUU26341.1 peptidoglycan-binding protein [Streptomyces sp. DSM 40750]
MRKNRIAVLIAATVMLLTGGIGGMQTASAAPTIDGVCGSYWGTSWTPPTVSQGSVDTTSPSAVMLAQCYLNLSMSGDNLTVDGRFGPLSNTAARRFQSCAGLTVDGYVGPNTWNSLRYWANSPNYVCNLDL